MSGKKEADLVGEVSGICGFYYFFKKKEIFNNRWIPNGIAIPVQGYGLAVWLPGTDTSNSANTNSIITFIGFSLRGKVKSLSQKKLFASSKQVTLG